jgi:hypothetical protein
MWFFVFLLSTSVASLETECFLNSTGIGTIVSVLNLESNCFVNTSGLGTLDMKLHFDSDCFTYDNETDIQKIVEKTNTTHSYYYNTALAVPICMLLLGQLYIIIQITRLLILIKQLQ